MIEACDLPGNIQDLVKRRVHFGGGCKKKEPGALYASTDTYKIFSGCSACDVWELEIPEDKRKALEDYARAYPGRLVKLADDKLTVCENCEKQSFASVYEFAIHPGMECLNCKELY